MQDKALSKRLSSVSLIDVESAERIAADILEGIVDDTARELDEIVSECAQAVFLRV